MGKNILVSDYDQTFYLNDEDIEKNKKAIELFREKENIFIIATGRSYLDFNNKKSLYNIKYDYLIINHGATTLDSHDNVMHNYVINNDIVSELKKDLELEKAIEIFCCSKLESRVDFEHQNLTKIHVKYNETNDAIRINSRMKEKYSKYINSYLVSNLKSIEIISNETDKSLAIEKMVQDLNISENNVFTVGDGYSDIEMVKKFNGYCMKESIEDLKKIAKNEVSSVSEIVENLLNKEGENIYGRIKN